MTQTELAEKSGVTQAFVSLVLNGERRPNYATAKRWEEITGIVIDVWMTADAWQLREAFEAVGTVSTEKDAA